MTIQRNSTPDPLAKPGKGQFKCFHCRHIVQMKDGDWHIWNNMEVHLCRICDKSTTGRPERRTQSKSL